MKNLILIIVLFLIFLSNTNHIRAYAENKTNDDLNEQVEDTISDINYSELEKFFADLEDSNKYSFGNSIKQMLNSILKGERTFSADKIYKVILSNITDSIFYMLPMVISILVIGILYGLSGSLTSSFLKKGSNEIIYYVCFGAILIILISTISSIVFDVRKTIVSIARLIDIAFPILLTLVAALGGISTVAVYQPASAILATVILKVIVNIVMPLFIASVIFCIISSLSYTVKLDKLTNTARSTAEWILGIVFTLFIAFIVAEGITGATFDTITVKSAKFAISSYVPIIGGHISDGFDLVMASLVLIKNSFGLITIIILILIIIAPIIKILILSFMLKLCSAILEPISDKRISDLLFNITKCLNLLLLIIIGFAFIIFIMIILIIVTCNMGVI